jgi:hypothetical protein
MPLRLASPWLVCPLAVRVARGLACLVVGCLLTLAGGDAARASCGDYLIEGDASELDNRQMDAMPKHGGDHPPGHVPACKGPNCGRRSLPPLAPEPAPHLTSTDVINWRPGDFIPPVNGPRFGRWERHLLLQDGHRFEIEHPPRLLATSGPV